MPGSVTSPEFAVTLRLATKWRCPQRSLKVPSVDDVLRSIERGHISASKAETVSLDFKTEKPGAKETFQDLAEAAVCFANAIGGVIVVGVSDTGTGADAFVGTSLDVHRVRSRIHDLTQPALTVTVTDLTWVGRRLLVIDVPEGLDVYSTARASLPSGGMISAFL
jgi:ATP-dependent DNA helicase RecG